MTRTILDTFLHNQPWQIISLPLLIFHVVSQVEGNDVDKRAWNSGFNSGMGKRAWNSKPTIIPLIILPSMLYLYFLKRLKNSCEDIFTFKKDWKSCEDIFDIILETSYSGGFNSGMGKRAWNSEYPKYRKCITRSLLTKVLLISAFLIK